MSIIIFFICCIVSSKRVWTHISWVPLKARLYVCLMCTTYSHSVVFWFLFQDFAFLRLLSKIHLDSGIQQSFNFWSCAVFCFVFLSKIILKTTLVLIFSSNYSTPGKSCCKKTTELQGTKDFSETPSTELSGRNRTGFADLEWNSFRTLSKSLWLMCILLRSVPLGNIESCVFRHN